MYPHQLRWRPQAEWWGDETNDGSFVFATHFHLPLAVIIALMWAGWVVEENLYEWRCCRPGSVPAWNLRSRLLSFIDRFKLWNFETKQKVIIKARKSFIDCIIAWFSSWTFMWVRFVHLKQSRVQLPRNSYRLFIHDMSENEGNYQQYFIDLNQIYCILFGRVVGIYISEGSKWKQLGSRREFCIPFNFQGITLLTQCNWVYFHTASHNHPHSVEMSKSFPTIFPRFSLQLFHPRSLAEQDQIW